MSPSPACSLIICTCDRSGPLAVLLWSLYGQSKTDFEVVVVVGPTRDDTRDMLERQFAGQLRIIDCPHFNLSRARNLGIRNSSGEIVAFIDDDAVPCPTWVSQIETSFLDPKVAGFGGRTYNVHNGELQFLSGWATDLGEQQDVRMSPGEPLPFASPSATWFPRLHGCNMSYRRQAIEQIGGFDENYDYLFDDVDICARLHRAGYHVVNSPDAVVYHAPATGRHRGQRAYDINWHNWLRSTVYFTLKNGSDQPLSSRLRWSARHANRLLSAILQARQEGLVDHRLYRKSRRQLLRGFSDGLAQGLLRKRRLAEVRSDNRALPTRLSFCSSAVTKPRMTPTSQPKATATSAPPSLRLALLSHDLPPRNTHGVARHTWTLATALAREGHEVHVLTGGARPLSRSESGVYIHHTPLRPHRRYQELAHQGLGNLGHLLSYSHSVYDRLIDLHANHGLDLVDSTLWNLEGLVTALAGTLPVFVRPVTSTRQISSIHHTGDDQSRLIGDLEEVFLRMARGILANSRATRRTVSEVYGIDECESPIRLVPFGEPALPDEAVSDLSQRGEGPARVLFVGRLEGRKGILDLFEAIPPVLEEHPETRFVIAGADNSMHDGFQAWHGTTYPEHFSRHHGRWADNVTFLGHVTDDQLEELYHDADIFVAPSHYESFGLVLIEAMNHARPVVSCRAGGPEDIVADGETGLLTPPSDPARLAAAIVRLVGDRDLRVAFGRAGRSRFLEHFTDGHMARAFTRAYRLGLEEEIDIDD